MGVLTRDRIVELVAKLLTKRVDNVPHLDGDVFIRRLSGGQRDERDLWALKNAWSEEDEKAGRGRAGNLKYGTQHVRATLVAMCLCDEAGELLFDRNKLDDLKIVSGIDGEALDHLYDEVRKFNGLGKEAEEEIAKNLPDDQSDSSG